MWPKLRRVVGDCTLIIHRFHGKDSKSKKRLRENKVIIHIKDNNTQYRPAFLESLLGFGVSSGEFLDVVVFLVLVGETDAIRVLCMAAVLAQARGRGLPIGFLVKSIKHEMLKVCIYL